jgi:hypothetical protein
VNTQNNTYAQLCDEIMSIPLPKIIIIILIQVAIALVHVFRLGQIFQGQAYTLYYSYFSDVILPFGMYFLLSLNDVTISVGFEPSTTPIIPLPNSVSAIKKSFQKWYVKAGLIFTLTTFAEICQFFGIEVLGVTFDPFDILMYGIGVSVAAFIDVKVFAKYLGFWANPKDGKKYRSDLRLT